MTEIIRFLGYHYMRCTNCAIHDTDCQCKDRNRTGASWCTKWEAPENAEVEA